MSNQENRPEAQLGAIFDELINSIGETKQAIWSAWSTDRRIRLEALKAYLAEHISRSRLAELLDVNTADVDREVKRFGGEEAGRDVPFVMPR